MQVMRQQFTGILCILFMASSALADTIELKDGPIINGKIIARDDSKVQVDFSGTMLTFWMDEVKSISTPPVTVQGAAVPLKAAKSFFLDALAKSLPQSLEEIDAIKDILAHGWKDGPATTALSKNKQALMNFKAALLQEPDGNDFTAVSDTGFMNMDRLQKLSVLLLVESEQARAQDDKALSESDLLAVLQYCIFLTNQKSTPEFFVPFEVSTFDVFSALLSRNIHETEHDKAFFQSIIGKLKQMTDDQVFVDNLFKVKARDIRNNYCNVEDQSVDTKSLVDWLTQKGLSFPALPLEKVVINHDFLEKMCQNIGPEVDQWRLDAQEAVRDNRPHELDNTMKGKIKALSNRISLDHDGDLPEKAILVGEYVVLKTEIPKVAVLTNSYYFFLSQVKIVYLGMQAKLFAMDNGQSVTSLAELVPRYVAALPKDDFNDRKDFYLYSTPQGKRICGVGVDRTDDQGQTLLTLKNFRHDQTKGDICFSF